MCAPNMKFLSLTIYRKYKGLPKFQTGSRDQTTPLKRSIFHQWTKGFTQCIRTQNLERVSLSVQKLWRRSKILNSGHETLTTPTLEVSLPWVGYYITVCAPNRKFLSLSVPKIYRGPKISKCVTWPVKVSSYALSFRPSGI